MALSTTHATMPLDLEAMATAYLTALAYACLLCTLLRLVHAAGTDKHMCSTLLHLHYLSKTTAPPAGATQLHRAVTMPYLNAAPQRVDLYRPGPAESSKMAPTGAFLLEKSLSAKKKAGFVTAVEPADKQ